MRFMNKKSGWQLNSDGPDAYQKYIDDNCLVALMESYLVDAKK